MARRLAPASRWGLGSRSEPGLWLAPELWLAPGLWSESGLLPERRLEPEWMRTSGPGPRRLGMNSSPGRNRPIGSSGRRRARNTVVSTWQWCYSSDWAVSHQSDNTDARSVILGVARLFSGLRQLRSAGAGPLRPSFLVAAQLAHRPGLPHVQQLRGDSPGLAFPSSTSICRCNWAMTASKVSRLAVVRSRTVSILLI